MFDRFPFYKQLDKMDCGPACLRMIARYYGRHYSAQTLRERTGLSKNGVSMLGISEAAEAIGFRTVGIKLTIEQLVRDAPVPCVLHWNQNHFVVLHHVKQDKNPSFRRLMSNIMGGRNSHVSAAEQYLFKQTDIEPSDHYQHYSGSDSPQHHEPPVKRVSHILNETLFFIADPAQGNIEIGLDEFKKNWLNKRTDGHSEGLALLLEPTPQFFEQSGEKGNGLHFIQLLTFLWRFRSLLLQLAVGMMVGSGLSLLMPLLTQSIVDIGIATQNLDFINLVLIAQVSLLLGMSTLEFLRSWILLHISTRINITILSEFISKLTRLPIAFYDVRHFGDIMQRVGDHARIDSFLTNQTLSILFSVFNLIVFGFVLAYYNITIFTTALIASILYCFWVLGFLTQRATLDKRRFSVSSKNQSQLIQLIQGMPEIKLAGAETARRWEWEHTQANMFHWNVRSLSVTQIQKAGALLINQSKNIIITIIAAKSVVEGEMTLGAMLSIQYILGQFNAPIEQLIGFLQSFQDAKISLERLNEIHSIDDEEPANVPFRQKWDNAADIVLKDVTYTYPGIGNEPVINNVTLRIPHGRTTAIVGSSGSGKTTLLKLLLKFYHPQSGSIILSGSGQRAGSLVDKRILLTKSIQNERAASTEVALNAISTKNWRKQCGVVMQDGFIFSDSIARNIAVEETTIDEDRLLWAAELANIHEFIESLPMGYHTKIGAEGNGISQGQRQRILIARSLYKNPNLFLFDEATNALDTSNESVIVKNLKSYFKGKTVVIVAHRLSTVRDADQIVVMEKGKIAEIGTHESLLAMNGKYYELVNSQLL